MKYLIITFFIVVFFLPVTIGAQDLKDIDEIAPFSEGFAAIRRGEEWGFINEKGDLVIPFRDDIYWDKNADTSKLDLSGVRYPMFKEGRCLISEIVEEGITVVGFMDTDGKVIIEPQFLNIYPFKDGYSTGVLFDKAYKGENEFKLKIYDLKFFDVLVDTSGHIEEYFERRHNIQMTKRRYKLPPIMAKRLVGNLVALRSEGDGWEIRKIEYK